MKLSLYVLSSLILLVVVFFGGVRFNQHSTSQNAVSAVDRQILHYVDPMNPAHTSKEPGIAPCGMPMEPVYADTVSSGGPAFSTVLGAVSVNHQKQQIIGVQIGEVSRAPETQTIRALGRIAPDENRVYALIAPADGWVEVDSESKTGSVVAADQILARIKIYNYDFYTWQQRYLTELGITGSRRLSSSPLSGSEQVRRRISAREQDRLANPEPVADMNMPSAATLRESGTQAPPHGGESAAPDVKSVPAHSGVQAGHHEKAPAASEQLQANPVTDHSEHMENMASGSDGVHSGTAIDNLFSYSRARQELLSLGVGESQLAEFAGQWSPLTQVELRSPAEGLVLSRKISPLQRIDKGTECFRIADLSRVWVEADMYDIEARSIQPGMKARVSLPRQGEHFTATVSEVLPRFDAVSRSLKIRLEMDNPAYLFRPDMFVDVEFLVPLPESVTVPSGAVIDSGKRKTVYVVKGEGIFEPRTVMTGWRTSDRVEIVEGVQPGEKIVISGNFLIDSESRMKLAAARLMEEKAEQPLQQQMPAAAQTSAPQAVPPAIIKEARAQITKDPVCGMSVNPDQATAAGFTAEVDGKRYFFCSADCKEQFTQEPQRYLGEQAEKPKQTDASAHNGHQHD